MIERTVSLPPVGPRSDWRARNIHPARRVRSRNQKDRLAERGVVHPGRRPANSVGAASRPILARADDHQPGRLVGRDRVGVGKRNIDRRPGDVVGPAARGVDDRTAGVRDKADRKRHGYRTPADRLGTIRYGAIASWQATGFTLLNSVLRKTKRPFRADETAEKCEAWRPSVHCYAQYGNIMKFLSR